MADVGRCASCKHWNTAADQYHIENFMWHKLEEEKEKVDPNAEVSPQEVKEAMKPWGECQAVLQKENAPDDAIALLSDGSGYHASLSTLANFGCVLWEES